MNTSWDVIRNIGDGKVKSMELERQSFEKILSSYNDAGLGVWAVLTKAELEFIGAASMTALSATAEIQLGYRFKKEFWGLGYATEIAKGLIEYGFNRLQLKRVSATTNISNVSSQNVLQKAGLEFRKKENYDGVDMNYYEIERTN